MDAGHALDIRLLGRFSVRRDGQEIPPPELGGRLGRLLIRILVTRRGTVVPVDVLVDALWPDRPPADPAANVAVLLSRVRRALGKPGLLAAATGGYLLTADDSCVVDAEIFIGHAQSGRAHLDRGRLPPALMEFLAAIDSWRGEPLPEDTYSDWSQEYRERLLRAYVQVLEGGAQAALQLGHAPIAEALAARAIAREPLRETGYLLLMRALAASGNQAAALASFEALKAVLAEELAVEPSGEAVELRRQVAAGGPLPGAPSRPRSLPALPADRGTAELPFVGRRQELEAIEEMHTRLDHTLVLLTGGAGVGKSRLLAEAAARTRLPLLAARGFLPDREDAWGVAQALLREALSLDPDAVRSIPGPAARALADLVPEIAELRPIEEVVIDPESRRALVLEGGARLISAPLGGDGVILIDDFQWTDASTLELLQQVMRRQRRLHLVVAYRPEEMTGDRAAGAFVPGLEGLAMVRTFALGRLAREEIAELVDDESLVRAIEEETDGTPLAVAEVLRLLAGEGLVLSGPRGRFRAVSPGAGERSRTAARAGQREAIRRRVERLTPAARQVLRLLALLGGEVPAGLLARAVGAGQRRVLEALDLLSRTELAMAGEQGWAISHDLVGEAVIEALRPAERARLHGLAVQALALEGADPGTIAAHQLGAGDRDAAAVSYARAARSSLQRFAHSEAGRLAEEGLVLEPAREPRTELLAVRAEVRARSGDLAGARDDLRVLLTLKEPGPGRSRVLTRMAMLASGSEDYTVAADLVELALAEAGRDDRAKAEALTTGAIVVMNLNDLAQADARFDEALRLFQRLGDARGAADILDGRAMALWAGGRIREAADAMDHVARLFLDAGELLRVGFPRASRATLLHWMAQPGDGLHDADEALGLERALGNLDGECYALCSRSGTLLGLGRTEEAPSDATEALALALRLQHREWIAYSYWTVGQARLATGDLAGAEDVFARGFEAARNLPIFSSYNVSGMAIALTRRGEFEAARRYVQRALLEATPQTIYESRLAAAELAVAAGDPDAARIIGEAISQAEEGGHLLSAGRLGDLGARL